MYETLNFLHNPAFSKHVSCVYITNALITYLLSSLLLYFLTNVGGGAFGYGLIISPGVVLISLVIQFAMIGCCVRVYGRILAPQTEVVRSRKSRRSRHRNQVK